MAREIQLTRTTSKRRFVMRLHIPERLFPTARSTRSKPASIGMLLVMRDDGRRRIGAGKS